MLERFQGKDGRAALLNALRSQFLVDGNTDVADTISSVAHLAEFAPGTRLFTRGDRGADLFMILAGQVSVRLGEIEVASIGAGMHTGEMALLEPFKGRSATVDAIDTVVVAQISGLKFTEIASHHPELWRRLAIELARRLIKLEATIYLEPVH